MTRFKRDVRNQEENPAYLHDHYQNDTPVQDSVNAITGTMAQPPGMEHEVEIMMRERSEVLSAIRSLEQMLTSTGKSAIRTTEAGGEVIIRTVTIPAPTLNDSPPSIKLVSYNYNRSRIQLYSYSAPVAIGTDPSISMPSANNPSANAIELPGFGPITIATVRDIWACQIATANTAARVMVIEEFIAPQDR